MADEEQTSVELLYNSKWSTEKRGWIGKIVWKHVRWSCYIPHTRGPSPPLIPTWPLFAHLEKLGNLLNGENEPETHTKCCNYTFLLHVSAHGYFQGKGLQHYIDILYTFSQGMIMNKNILRLELWIHNLVLEASFLWNNIRDPFCFL
jgi:hypothetical protein